MFESGNHRITMNDGNQTFAFRIGHDFGDTNSGQFTQKEDGYPGVFDFNQSTGIMRFGPVRGSTGSAG